VHTASKKYGVDKNGFILTKVKVSKIKKPFVKLIAEVKDELLLNFEEQIDSIYLYGSVATGEAEVKKSDLDVLVVFKKKPSIKSKKLIENLSEKLSKKHKALVREVGIVLSDVKEVNKDTYGWGCFLKHLCVDIHGENLSGKLPNFKPTRKVAEAFNGDCKKVIMAARKKLSGHPNKKEVLKISSSTARKILRTGFSLVMEKEKSWTTDLKKSYLVFTKHYPEQKAAMKKVLEMALSPTNSKSELIELLQDVTPLLAILNFVEKPPTRVLIREAKLKDAQGIATVHVETWQHAYRGQIPNKILDKLSIEERTEQWQEKLKNPDASAKAFVAVVKGEVCGFSSSGPSRDRDADKITGELYAIYIDAEKLRKGLGHSLMGHALKYLKSLGFKKATLWVLATNKNAIKFYKKEGWKSDGKTKTEKNKGFEMKEVRYSSDLKS